MVLTGYFDETGVHKTSPISMMAGFVGDARQWRSYEKRVSKLFHRFKVDVFHAIDVRRGDDCFAGWTVNKKLSFLDEFHHIINETTEIGFNSVITEDDYQWYLSLKRPASVRARSKYAILVRSSLASAVDSAVRVERWATIIEPALHVILELGHKNSSEALEFYQQAQAMLPGHKALGGLTFKSKKDCLPLAASDLFAYSVYRMETGGRPLGIMKGTPKAVRSYRQNLYREAIGRDVLTALHEQPLFLAGRKTTA